MTTQTLSHLTLQSLDNSRSAATQAVAAYRLGGHRLVRVVNGALKSSVYPRTAKLAPRATDRMNAVRGNVSDIVVKGIDQSAAAEQVIALGASSAAAQVSKAAAPKTIPKTIPKTRVKAPAKPALKRAARVAKSAR